MKRFSIGYIRHSPETHERYLGYSLANLQGECDVLSTSDHNYPAQNYNDLLDACKTEYLILTHQDVSFPPNLLACIQRTIDFASDFGVLGMVGVDAAGTHRWSTNAGIYEVDTLDCCFIVVKKSAPARFDTVGFGEYHLYVEDYCAQMNRQYGKKNYTLHIEAGEVRDTLYSPEFPLEKLRHHSATVSKLGYCWGRYSEFRETLEKKWLGVKTT
ncbi:hypothetical protein [Rhodoferax aquaticus]|uniref:Uncharacterized protein n=1 Tax=Rhodoferax aquaticus TaxID=2527691 RepID=A0A515ETU4_9BURK|nr:hypothetical protein [Rhodoferax aquaticus]QDL56082.1 hypothetical protein EXZ61_19025 [Rhodoferax aquaticus]